MKNTVLFICFLLSAYTVIAQEKPEGLFISSKAPDFKAKDQFGNEIRLKDLLKKGKVVLVFYRGQWCPYCNKELSRLQDSLQFIRDKGAEVVAVSPEKPENVAVTVEKTKAEYPILYDEGLKIMKAYDVEFEMEENTVTRYRNAGLDIEKNNGANGRFLPVPAVYIIDKESTVTYRFFEPDYKKRPSVKELLKNL
ncbi:MAG: AhpC/TSA family protein [Chitinophagaceae bacterium]|nr:AhpC/TSA family protein [Chitinophagaceae bacterium]HQV60192.1 peroxiredoxin-like family protein [Chitinophagaceae bacterium]HQV86595.1 peroxiredoxin-like family protein [Chitinophagaceae bacterium]HQZ73907.1 peroxiredoxin-like family protein [Chitinophagaceae bacterium]